MKNNNKLKITFVINSLKNRNGASVFLMNLLCSLKAKEDVDFILVSLYDNVDKSFYEQAFANGIEIIKCHKKSKLDISSARVFRTIIKSFNPDIINFHLPIYVTYFLSFGLKRRNWKIVKTYHSIPGRDLSRLNLLLEKCYVKKKMVNFIAITKSICSESEALYPKSVTETIYNGIPLPKNNNFQLDNKEFDFVIVASLEEVKNHILLFNAFEKATVLFPQAKLAVVGSGSKHSEYELLVKSKKLDKNIFFLGQLQNVADILLKSRVFVLSSTREGNPISILEAMSFGLPILAPNIGGIPDVVENGINGFLFNVNDEKKLSEYMINFMNNIYDYSSISKRNIEKSLQFSIDITCNKYIDYFKRLKRR